jgi:PleD family two-component response regulator
MGQEMTSLDMATAGANQPATRPRILIVDDEPGIRAFIARALTAAGYVTESASDPALSCTVMAAPPAVRSPLHSVGG